MTRRWLSGIGAIASKRSHRQALIGYLFISPWVIGLVVFTAGPFLAGFLISLTDYSAVGAFNWVGLGNYREILDDPKVVQAGLNTLVYVAMAVPLNTFAGLAIALLLNREIRGRAFFRTAIVLPAMIPVVPSLLILAWILNDQFGLLNMGLGELGVAGPPWLSSATWSKPGLVLWNFWQVGVVVVIYLAGLQAIPKEQYEAASLDGAGAFAKFRTVTLPLLSPTLLFVFTLQIIFTFQTFTAAIVVGGGVEYATTAGPSNSLLLWVVYIYQSGFYFFKLGYAAALAWILFIVIMIVTLVQFRLARRWVHYEMNP